MYSIVLLVSLIFGAAHGFPGGAPEGACPAMVPVHGVPPQSTASPYIVTVSSSFYQDGGSITVTLSGSPPFKGFLLVALPENSNSTSPVGSFSTAGSLAQARCNGGLTHTRAFRSAPKSRFIATWNAPSTGSQNIEFFATFVQSQQIFWVKVRSQVVLRVPSTAAPTTPPSTTSVPATAAPTTAAPTTVAPTTAAPSTSAPATPPSTTVAPSTVAPTTAALSTSAPATPPPTTAAPTTAAPTTAVPITDITTTDALPAQTSELPVVTDRKVVPTTTTRRPTTTGWWPGGAITDLRNIFEWLRRQGYLRFEVRPHRPSPYWYRSRYNPFRYTRFGQNVYNNPL